eukprot:13688-Heterococcus_DN1.PRE.2
MAEPRLQLKLVARDTSLYSVSGSLTTASMRSWSPPPAVARVKYSSMSHCSNSSNSSSSSSSDSDKSTHITLLHCKGLRRRQQHCSNKRAYMPRSAGSLSVLLLLLLIAHVSQSVRAQELSLLGSSAMIHPKSQILCLERYS